MFQNLPNIIKFISIFISIICVNFNANAASDQAYTTADVEKIAIIIGIVILIFSPSKFRVIVLGTLLGLTFAYLTYKYLLPILLTL